MSGLRYVERPALGAPAGLLVLHHGRGADEHNLLALGDALDPQRRLHVVAPRGPLVLESWPGFHWYTVPRVGHPDHDTFFAALALLSAFHEDLWQRTGIDHSNTVLGGFSMGAVMSYALSLSADRPAPGGVLAFSGFLPTVTGWQASFGDRQGLRAFIAHGRNDPVIAIDFARSARRDLQAGGLAVSYHESEVKHSIDPTHLQAATRWLATTLGLDPPS